MRRPGVPQPFVMVMVTPRISPLEFDLHHLLAAVGAQVQVGGKSGGLDEHVDLAAAGGALQIAENVAALFAPVAGDALTLAGHVAGKIELVAVAGAMQVLLQAEP